MELYSECNDQYNLFGTCRACLRVDGTMVDVLSSGEREENLLSIYVGILNSEIADNVYPFLLCQQCEEKLLQTHAFHNQCRKSNAVIQKYLIEKADNPALNVVIVKEENNFNYESEDDSNLYNSDETDSNAGKKEDGERSKLKQFPKDEVIEAINDLTRPPLPKVINCMFCHFEAKSSRSITNHVLLAHSDVQNKWCSICNEVYEDLPNHSHPVKSFKCKFCSRDSSTKRNLIVHLRSHAGIRPYKCIECGKGFVTPSHLRNHHRMHKGLKPYQCEICNRYFAQSHGLKKHMRTHADADNPNRLEIKNFCDMCNKRVRSLKVHQLKVHVKSKASKSKRIHKCSICRKRLSSNSKYVAHMRTHIRETPNQPKFWDSITTKSDHERNHTEEKTYECKV